MTDESLSENDVIWKPIKEFNGTIEINNLGQVRFSISKDTMPVVYGGTGSYGYKSQAVKFPFGGKMRQISPIKYKKLYFPESIKESNCINCNKMFAPCTYHEGNGHFKYCSVRCSKQYYYRSLKKRTACPIKERECIVCYNMFMPIGKESICSDACRIERRKFYSLGNRVKIRLGKKSGTYLNQRVKFYGVKYENVNPIAIFDKYKWTCVFCGIQMKKEDMGKAKKQSPEIDHIVPLSLGGDHVEGWEEMDSDKIAAVIKDIQSKLQKETK